MLLLEDDTRFSVPENAKSRWDRHLVGITGGFPSAAASLTRWCNTRSVDANRYYEYLGVSRSASPEEIRKAYLKMAQELHPDHGGNEEEFKYLNQVYETLGDFDSRQNYDEVQQGELFVGEFERSAIRNALPIDVWKEAMKSSDKPSATSGFYSFYGSGIDQLECASAWYDVLVPVMRLLGFSGKVILALETTDHPYLFDSMVVMPEKIKPNFFTAWHILINLFAQDHRK